MLTKEQRTEIRSKCSNYINGTIEEMDDLISLLTALDEMETERELRKDHTFEGHERIAAFQANIARGMFKC